MAGYQVTTKAALLLFLLNWTGERNTVKDLWVEIRTERDRSPITVTGKTDSIWGN